MSDVIRGGWVGPTPGQVSQQNVAAAQQGAGQVMGAFQNAAQMEEMKRQFEVTTTYQMMNDIVERSYEGDWALFADKSPSVFKNFLDRLTPKGTNIEEMYNQIRTGARTAQQFANLAINEIRLGNAQWKDIGFNESPLEQAQLVQDQVQKPGVTAPVAKKEVVQVPEEFKKEEVTKQEIPGKPEAGVDWNKLYLSGATGVDPTKLATVPEDVRSRLTTPKVKDQFRSFGMEMLGVVGGVAGGTAKAEQLRNQILNKYPELKEALSGVLPQVIESVNVTKRNPTLGDAAWTLYKQRTGKEGAPDYKSEEWKKAQEDVAKSLGLQVKRPYGWDNQAIKGGEIGITSGGVGPEVPVESTQVAKDVIPNEQQRNAAFTPTEQLDAKGQVQKQQAMKEVSRWVVAKSRQNQKVTGNLTYEQLANALNIAGGQKFDAQGRLGGEQISPEDNPIVAELFYSKTAAEKAAVTESIRQFEEELKIKQGNLDLNKAYYKLLGIEKALVIEELLKARATQVPGFSEEENKLFESVQKEVSRVEERIRQGLGTQLGGKYYTPEQFNQALAKEFKVNPTFKEVYNTYIKMQGYRLGLSPTIINKATMEPAKGIGTNLATILGTIGKFFGGEKPEAAEVLGFGESSVAQPTEEELKQSNKNVDEFSNSLGF